MKKKILLIEDDLALVRSLQKLFTNAGFDIDWALDGEEGLAKVSDVCDCIVLDLALPKKDGWEVLEELKNNDGTKHVPVVICTVLDGDHYRKRAKDLGADGYVNKFHDDLLGEVERILGAL